MDLNRFPKKKKSSLLTEAEIRTKLERNIHLDRRSEEAKLIERSINNLRGSPYEELLRLFHMSISGGGNHDTGRSF